MVGLEHSVPPQPIALSDRIDPIDSSALIVPAVGEIIECSVFSSSQETLKE